MRTGPAAPPEPPPRRPVAHRRASGGPPARPGRTVAVRAEVAERCTTSGAHRRVEPNNRPPRWVERLAWCSVTPSDPATGDRRRHRRVHHPGSRTGGQGGPVDGRRVARVLAGVSWPTIVRMLWTSPSKVVGLIRSPASSSTWPTRPTTATSGSSRPTWPTAATRRSSLGVILALVLTSIVGPVMMVVLSLLASRSWCGSSGFSAAEHRRYAALGR